MLSKQNISSEVPLTHSGLTPSVTGLALQRKKQGPDLRQFVITGGQIRPASPHQDVELIESSLRPTGNIDPRKDPKLILESAAMNLGAGIRFLEKQSAGLQRISERLADAARLWKMSRITDVDRRQLINLQAQFHDARQEVRSIRESTEACVPLFSDGQSSPIRLHHPFREEWQLLLIDRSDLGSPSMSTFAHGKIYGDDPGFHLDLETIQKTSRSVRLPQATNQLQAKLMCSCLSGVMERLSSYQEHLSSQDVPSVQLPQSTTLFRTFN